MTCPHCGKPITDKPDTEPATARAEAVCWRAPNAHPPHLWYPDNNPKQPALWCPGVKGTTMY